MPNAGKSTLISKISSAKPKIADYPFTTLSPNLGVVQSGFNSFVVADIPGLIPGASEGVGLGIQFLKHLSRVEVLLHIVDVSSYNVEVILKNIKKKNKRILVGFDAHFYDLMSRLFPKSFLKIIWILPFLRNLFK